MKVNILITPDERACIAGFGLSRFTDVGSDEPVFSTSFTKGPMRWMAPELFDIETDAHHTKESDVWAFGMTIYVSSGDEGLSYIDNSHLLLTGIIGEGSSVLSHSERTSGHAGDSEG